ncbi:MAG: ATP phosphoribosyltransferase regulatory subunit [Betaproteobacteria bacterium]|nr:ATP phosphoribosyltransferase regulatory subunit [Betaproteobacteria bacterium]
MPAWQLPDQISDILPAEAARLERLRRRLLDLYQSYGYALVQPPMLEHLDSLMIDQARDLDLRTFKVVDQASGRLLGLRADITPQAARLDAHQIQNKGVTRLCYAGSVLHAQPAGLLSSREPVQMGCELFGHDGLEADLEIQELALASLDAAGIQKVRLDLSHRGIFLALRDRDSALAACENEVLAALQSKDRVGLAQQVKGLSTESAKALTALIDLYGPASGADNVIDAARRSLPKLAPITEALDRLQSVANSAMFTEHPQCVLTVDFADLRGYRYHNGVMFSIYCEGLPNAVVRGGRYDGAGKVFGRARAATGFSLELRELLEITNFDVEPSDPGIAAPWQDDAGLRQAIAALRREGRVVIRLPDAEFSSWTGQRMTLQSGRWVVAQAN